MQSLWNRVSGSRGKDEEKIYDSYDCPMCGSQVIAQERKRKFKPNLSCDFDDDTEAEEDEEENA